jgi:very-short-patch-repair endonuclease
MNFGPLNRDGGWRRQNVAITRARQEMIIFSSFGPGMMDLGRVGDKARAIRDLKHFLDFAERGPRALGEAVAGSVGGYDSPFEEAVARALRERGWQVVPQVGVSRFRIDAGIVHPDRPGDFLAGVECDGATYHRAATARDRDKVGALILEGLGWRLVRVWSTDWWVDKAGALGRLHRELMEILQESRERHKAEEEAATRRAEQERVEREAEAAKKAAEASTSPALPIMHPYRLTDSPAKPALQPPGKAPSQFCRFAVMMIIQRLRVFAFAVVISMLSWVKVILPPIKLAVDSRRPMIIRRERSWRKNTCERRRKFTEF